MIDLSLPHAVEIEHADFTWDGVPPEIEDGKKAKRHKKPAGRPEPPKPINSEHVFKLKDISLTIPRGRLTAIVGPVGSGKSSLLQGLIGEMRREKGTVKFGGSVGYCQQSAWIQVQVYFKT